MAITLTGTRTAVNIKLNNGVDQEGKLKTVNLNLGSLKASDFTSEDCQKAMNIINALQPCLDKTVYSTQKTHVDEMIESA